ncbi:LacI family DNA-binding transcriptional regulator [Cellulomonas sp. Y8]|uniref:LacI family DNA-binding transcriptional regulator n=1 Tax=Cellulomonas sp. Y8 TaxID=2591145 RepID=UPI001AF0028C|nr:LacI family DNA-binding transcriptional regulator [Cellulomonas sp. Y8]
MPTPDAPRAATARAAARVPRVTIRAVAEHAGVSRQTVSNALNAPDRLSPGTLERVRRSVTALGYRPDHAARALTSRRSGLIGIRVGATAHRTPRRTPTDCCTSSSRRPGRTATGSSRSTPRTGTTPRRPPPTPSCWPPATWTP